MKQLSFSRARLIAVTLALAVLMIAAAAVVHAQLIQIRTDTFIELIQTLSAEGKPITFLFDRPITGTTTTLSTDSAQASVGQDYVCFAAPWNAGEVRQYCTPLSNVISITFTEPE